MRRTGIPEIAAGLAQNLTEEQLMRISGSLRNNELTRDSPASLVEDVLDIHGSSLQWMCSLLDRWQGSPESLSMCLASMALLKGLQSGERDIIDLVWTGPVQFSVPARTTLSTATEMISEAKRRVTVVGYRVTKGAKMVFDTLADVSTTGASIRIILDQATEQLGTLTELWPRSIELPDVYENQANGLHAKLIVVDARDVLVTSANLSYHGLQSNIEVGLRVRGRVASQIESLMQGLIDSGHLRKLAT